MRNYGKSAPPDLQNPIPMIHLIEIFPAKTFANGKDILKWIDQNYLKCWWC